MNKMKWDNDEQAYFGETSDGRTVRVEGAEWSESVVEGVHNICRDRGLDRYELMDEQNEGFVEEVERELDDPDLWAGLAGDNPNVEIVD